MSMDRPAFERFIRDWSPGFLDVPEEDTLPPGATPDAKNEWFVNRNIDGRDRAKLGKRPGMRLVNPTATANAKIDALFEFRRTGARELIKVINGRIAVFDGVNNFAFIAGTPFTAGNTARATFFRDNAFIHDGTAQKRFDGTTLFDVGQIAPTSVTNMTAAVPSGAGLTGTYEAEYVWYDPVMVHESSPSAITGTTALVGQARRHTQPGGAPAAQYTQWRAYVRRVDTNETKFMRVGTWNLASGTHDEEVSDTARVNPAPGANEHDPPPFPWAILVEWKGYFIGVPVNSSDVYWSKIGDAQSWHPRNSVSVRKGDGEFVTGVKFFGEDILIQKPHATWRFDSDAPPFLPKPVHSRYGGVSQESGVEVDGRFYDWDRERGPYVTDGLQFTALGDARIRDTIELVNRDALADIRCIHVEGKGLIGWAVATGATTRKRMILWYDYQLGSWVPPWTGLEYASFATFTNGEGVTGTYVGDYWGRVFELFSGDRDGVAANVATADLSASVTSATSGSVTAAGASFPTAGSGLAGLPVAVRDPAGNWQWRRVESNTGTAITLDTTNDAPWTTTPSSGWTVVVGGIEWYHDTPWLDEGRPEREKKYGWLFLQGRASSADHRVTVQARFNDDVNAASNVDFPFPPGTQAGVWGAAVWGASLFGTTTRSMAKHRMEKSAFSVQFRLSNFLPDQPITITTFGLTGDVMKNIGIGSV